MPAQHLSIYERRLGLLHLPARHKARVQPRVIAAMQRREAYLKRGFDHGERLIGALAADYERTLGLQPSGSPPGSPPGLASTGGGGAGSASRGGGGSLELGEDDWVGRHFKDAKVVPGLRRSLLKDKRPLGDLVVACMPVRTQATFKNQIYILYIYIYIYTL